MRNPWETWDMTSLYLWRKKEIPKKTTYKRTSKSGNGINRIRDTRQ